VSVQGVQKLTGENLGVVWAEFTALSSAVLLWHGIYKHARD
jgi:hypothetical protein